MSKKGASEIEKAFSLCSSIRFQLSNDSAKTAAAIILGFDDQASGAIGWSALTQWAKNGEIIIALLNKDDHVDATLIHTRTYESAAISQLSFNYQEYSDFLSTVAQDRKITLQCTGNSVSKFVGSSPSLTLVRYIIITPDFGGT